jgi:hypothetical protein
MTTCLHMASNVYRIKDWEQKYGQEEQIKSQMHAGRLCSQDGIVIGSLRWNEKVAAKTVFLSAKLLRVHAICPSNNNVQMSLRA